MIKNYFVGKKMEPINNLIFKKNNYYLALFTSNLKDIIYEKEELSIFN